MNQQALQIAFVVVDRIETGGIYVPADGRISAGGTQRGAPTSK